MPPGLYGYPAANETASVITDTAGTYAFSSLDPANYAICASTAERSPVDSGTGYAVGCNPETADSPRKISLGPEDTRLDVNVTVAAAPLRRVEGTLNVPEGVAKPDLLFLKNVEEIYVDPALHLRPGADGAFRFNNVPPGHYVLSAWTGPENDRAAVMEKVVVEDADVTGLVLTMHRGSRVAGHLEFHRTLTPSAGAKQPRVMLSPAVPASRSVRWGSCQATTDGTGAFVFPSVQPGTYRLTAEYLQPQDWYMESVAGAEQPGRLVKVQTGQHVSDLVVKMTDYRAELTGTLVSERGMAGSEFMVVVYPADPGEWAPPFTFGRASLDGTFRFRLRRPGVYRVGVILDYDPAIRVGPDLLRDVDRKALTVSVADGDKKAVKLVVPAER
jgi:hypothetical protein